MIYFLRHGETVWNVEDRIQGQLDSLLTVKGVAQAEARGRLLAELIGDEGRPAMVSSPLGRARQTAAIVARVLGIEEAAITYEPRLMELRFGDWEGMTWAEVKRAHPALHAAREADRWNFRPPGGESYSLVAARLGAWLEEQDPSRCIVAVGHGLAGRILRGLYANLDPAEIPSLGEPQDVVYRLTDGVVQEFKAAPD